MFNKRRAREADGDLDHSQRPWPVLQRRKIEKLKDERLREFERACGENFEWLENYYQGCVFAALQNRNYEDGHNGLNLSTSSNPEEPHHALPQSLDQDDLENSAPQDYNRDSLRTPTTSKRRKRDSHSYAGRGILTESLRHSQNRRSRSKQHSNQFLLKSPKSPILSSPMRTPRSPYERRRITPKRRRLRVDASAATRKAQRALRALRKRSSSYPETMDSDRHKDKRSSRQSSETESSSRQHQGRGNSSGPEHRETTHQLHASTPRKRARLNSTAVPKDSALTSDDDSTQTTPIRAPLTRVHSTTTPGQDHRSRRMGGMEVEVAVERKTTPGSRARDSMVLISPYSRPRSSSKERDADLSSTPDLTRGSSAVSRTTRMGMDMHIDLDDNDIEMDEADYKRPRSSSFRDSVAPVRFGSPEADGDNRQTQSANVGKETRMKGRATRTSKGSLLLEDDDLLRDIVENSLLRRSTAKDPSRRPSAPPSSTTPKHPPEAEIRAFRNEIGVGSDKDPFNRALGTDTGDRAYFNDTYPRHKSIQDTSLTKVDTMDHTDAAFEPSMNNADGPSRHDRPNYSTSVAGSIKHDKAETSRLTGQQERLEANTIDNADHTGDPETTQREPPSSAASNVRMQDAPSSSDSVVGRSRAPATLPEKRIIGTRRPVTQHSSSQGQQQSTNKMPPSRLTKLTMASSLTTASGASQGSFSSATLQVQNQSAVLSSSSTSRITHQQAASSADSTATSSTQSSTSTPTTSTLLRQGLPRAPLPSARVKGGSLARSESQGTLSTRKPLLTLKSTLTTKKQVRPALPTESTIAARSLAATLSGLSSANARERDMRRDVVGLTDSKRPQQQQQQDGEQTPDLATTGAPKEAKATGAAMSKTTSSSILLSALRARKEVQGHGQQSKVTDSSGVDSSQNPFLVPAAVRPPAASARTKQRETTVLPDIGSDGESDDLPMNAKSSADKDKQLPAWASWEALERAMEAQRHLNPQEIFGPLPPLDMAEMFPGRELRLRQRTSASHWTADRLTAQEVMKYNKEMGWAKN
ncbi:hypothetical protein BGZ67_006213 [Mortierella alpina]|nr:hypothetical protein BGZ67_006213 [Mortierella alpina]